MPSTVKSKQNSKTQLYRALFLFFFLCAGIFSFLGFGIWQNLFQFNTNVNKRFHVVISHPTAHIDQGFNQGAIEGVCLAFGFDVSKGECQPNSQVRKFLSFAYPGTTNNVSLFYSHLLNRHNVQGTKNFILPGFNYTGLLNKSVRKFESLKTNLIAIDTFYFPKKGENWPKNLWQFTFRHYFAGYHAGLYAGAYALKNAAKFRDGNPTKPGKQIRLATLGGQGIPPIYNYAIGFKLGIQMINKHRQEFNQKKAVELAMVAHENIGGFGDSEIPNVKRIMEKFLNKKYVSIVFSIAVSLTAQMLGSVRDANTRYAEQGYKHFVIGVDVDQGVTLNNEKTNEVNLESDVLTSAQIQIPFAVKDIIQKIKKGEKPTSSNFFGGHKYATIPERYKKTEIWSEIKKVLKEKINLNEITSVLNQVSGVSGFTNDNSGKINQIISLLYKNSKEIEKRKHKLNEALGAQDNFLETLSTWINTWTK